MIEWIFMPLAWLLGLFQTVQVLGAAYGLIDLRYRWRQYRWRVMGRLLLQLAIFALLPAILSSRMATAFFAGAIWMLAIHVLLMFLPNAVLLKSRRDEASDYRLLAGAIKRGDPWHSKRYWKNR